MNGFGAGQEMMRRATEGKMSEIDYMWPRPSSDTPVQKGIKARLRLMRRQVRADHRLASTQLHRILPEKGATSHQDASVQGIALRFSDKVAYFGW